MQRYANKACALLGALVSSSVIAAEPTSARGPIQRDQNAKVCEIVTPVGSRLATRKICATRAEWDDKRRQDREAVEKAQVVQCKVIPGRC